MQKNTIIFVVIAALGGFIGGFMLANSLNRSEMSSLRSQNLQPKTGDNNTATAPSRPDDLTADELRSKIAEADKNPGNFEFQKGLGTALYRYAAMKQDQALFQDALRILERANSLNARDFDVLVALGNTHFDLAFFKKDAVGFQKARDLYSKALEIRPADADVTTDLGLTWFLQNPPAYDKATAELQSVSDANPKHERSLQFLVQVYVKQNKLPEAEKTFEKLKAINPSNESIGELTSLIGAAKNGLK